MKRNCATIAPGAHYPGDSDPNPDEAYRRATGRPAPQRACVVANDDNKPVIPRIPRPRPSSGRGC